MAKRRGRPSIHEQHPEIVEFVKERIQQSGSAASLKRSDDTMYSNGATLKSLVKSVKDELNLTVSKDTVHRLMEAPRKKTINAVRYKELIPARVPCKQNNVIKIEHKDYHYTAAQVSLINQLVQLFASNTVSLSVDNKNKIDVGKTAVDRRLQIRKFALRGEEPNYPDHDFPWKGAKLVPAGYQLLVKKIMFPKTLEDLENKFQHCRARRGAFSESSADSKIIQGVTMDKDRCGRPHVVWPRTGPLNVHLYPNRCLAASSVSHCNFLLRYLHALKSERCIENVVLIADGGPDWQVKSFINLLVFGYLWRELQLDILVIQCYAPGCSRFNPIERSWSYLTQCLVSVELPVAVRENDFAIPAENDEEGWCRVMDSSITTCGKFWHGKEWDHLPITVYPLYSSDPVIPHRNEMHESVKKFKTASAKAVRESEKLTSLQKDYQFFVKHCRRKHYQLEFVRCDDYDCQHCSRLQRKNPLLDLVRSFGGSFPTPEMSVRDCHYKSLDEMLRLYSVKTYDAKKSIKERQTQHGICPFQGCHYPFNSAEDRKVHNRLMEHSKNQSK